MILKAWLASFLFTQAVEVPLYAREIPGGHGRRYMLAFLASLITHPLVWMLVLSARHTRAGYLSSATAAELFAVFAEWLWLRHVGVQRPLRLAVAANAASLGLGLLSRSLLGWP